MRHSMAWPLNLDILLRVAQLPSARDADLLLDDIDAGDHLRDGMLHLQAGVHFEEIKILILIHKKFNRARVDIIHGLGGFHSHTSHLLAQVIVQERRMALPPTVSDDGAGWNIRARPGGSHCQVNRPGSGIRYAARLRPIFPDRHFHRQKQIPLRVGRTGSRVGISSRLLTSRMPFPPPPAVALINSGNPICGAMASSSSSVMLPTSSVPGTTGTPALIDRCARFALYLPSPRWRMVWGR